MSHRAISFVLQCLLWVSLSTGFGHAQTTSTPLSVKVQLYANSSTDSENAVISDSAPTYTFPKNNPPWTGGGAAATGSARVDVKLVATNHYQIIQNVQGSARVDAYWTLPATVTATATSTTMVTLTNSTSDSALFYLNVSKGSSLVSAGCLVVQPAGTTGGSPTCPLATATSGANGLGGTWTFQGTASPLTVANPTTQGANTTECDPGGGSCNMTMTTDIVVTQTQTTSVTISEVDNGFSNVPNSPIQTAMWVAIKGTNLSSTNPGRGWNASESFPTSMDATSVTINNQPAFLYYISPTQLNLQAPSDTALGPVSVVVTNNGVSSAPVTATYQTSAPALLQWNGGQYPYAEITRGSDYIGNPAVITGTVSAKAGDILTLWATGLGATTPALPAGQQPTTTFPSLNTPPTVTVGSVGATVLAAVLRFAGLFQVNIQLPPSLPSGDQPIKLIQGSFQSPDGVLINIAP